MRSGRLMSLLIVGAAWLLVGGSMASAEEDPRSRVLLGYDCRTDTSHRELTLFANGTLRLRDGIGATREMRLTELGRQELEAYARRLEEIGFDDLAPSSPGPEGDWVERCRVDLDLPAGPVRSIDYGRYDTIPLGWKQVLLVVDDLLEEFDSSREASARVHDYEPAPGDILVRRRDGARYEVLGKTLEGTGVELEGLDEPITIFILLDHLLDEFDPPTSDGG